MNQLSGVHVQIARLMADVDNIKRTLAEIKTDLRWLDDKIYALRTALSAARD
jgi:hypothetical protein